TESKTKTKFIIRQDIKLSDNFIAEKSGSGAHELCSSGASFDLKEIIDEINDSADRNGNDYDIAAKKQQFSSYLLKNRNSRDEYKFYYRSMKNENKCTTYPLE